MKQLTIFTPTYNRAYCIGKLYESLKKQTCKEFLWLVVDDGSSDCTEELIQTFQAEKEIEIRYLKQTNAGKHAAHNKAVELCESELFVCVDSDDFLTEDAVETILKRQEEVKEESLLGFYMRKIRTNGENVAKPYPAGVSRVGIMDLYHKWDFSGDTVLIFRTNLIKEYAFPVFPEEKFVTERVFYNMLNEIAPMALFEDGIYVCEYLPDGYTKNVERLIIQNPYGSATDYFQEAYYGKKPIYKVKSYAQYLALVRLFRLEKKRICICRKPEMVIRVGAWLVLPHYMKLFRELREKYQC